MWLGYVDNSVIGGTDKAQVDALRSVCDDAFRKAGLRVHEETVAARELDTLGIGISDLCVLRPKTKRLWKYYQAPTCVLEGKWVSSHDLSILLGHLTFVWCIGRNFLAIGKASYSFVQHMYL